MKRSYFQAIECASQTLNLPIDEVIDQLAFNERGLIPVITQDVQSKAVLMMAWMNKRSLLATLETRRMTYWSRSRNQLWIKGETSGHYQEVKSITFDCDGDTILCQVNQTGAACHTGRTSCFYIDVDQESKLATIPGLGDGRGDDRVNRFGE